MEQDGVRKVMVVRQLEPSANRVRLAGHTEAGNLERRHNSPDDPFRWLMPSYNKLKSMRAERVRVDEKGQVWRVAPHEARRSLGL